MDQLTFPFPLTQGKLTEFLTRWCAIEDEQDRLREDMQFLKERYADAFPVRAVLTAVKIVRARNKLSTHAKEPMSPVHLAYLEDLVERHISGILQAADALLREIDGSAVTVRMTAEDVNE